MAACPKMAWRPAAETVMMQAASSFAKTNFRTQNLTREAPEGTVTRCSSYLALIKKLHFGNPQSKTTRLGMPSSQKGPKIPCCQRSASGWDMSGACGEKGCPLHICFLHTHIQRQGQQHRYRTIAEVHCSITSLSFI